MKQIPKNINSLCSGAGVGRASFYHNFKSKEDILKMYINKLFYRFVNDAASQNDQPLNVMVKLLFTHFEEHKDIRCLYPVWLD